MEDTAQRESDLHKKVGESLGVNPETLDPTHRSTLKKLEEAGAEILDVAQSVSTIPSEKISGETEHIEVMAAERPSLISRIRAKMKVWK